MKYEPIKIIAIGTNAEKGRALERAVGAIWARLGYREIRYNSHITGEEIDVQGCHVLTGDFLKGQCKAHASPINSVDLRLFFADITKAKAKNKKITGVFVAINGFSATSKSWYEELGLTERDGFKLIDSDQFIKHLIEAGMVKSIELIEMLILAKTHLEIQSVSLLLSERGIFWQIVFTPQPGLAKYFTLLGGDGSTPRQDDVEYLISRNSDPDLSLITFKGRESVILSLLEQPARTINEISKNIQESLVDTRYLLDSLVADCIVIINSDKFSLREEIEGFIRVIQLLENTPGEFRLMTTDFYQKSVKLLLLPYLEAKFRIKFSQPEASVLEKMLLISPNVLHATLRESAQLFRQFEQDLDRVKLSQAEAEKWQGQMRQNLIHKLASELARDQIEGRLTKLLSHHRVVLTRLRLDIAMASRQQPYIQLKVGISAFIAEAGESISAGQLVSVTGPGPILIQADALLALGDISDAEDKYNEVIRVWPDSIEAIASTHNLGVCALRKKDFDLAEQLFRSIFTTDDSIRLMAESNICRCLAYSRKEDALAVALENLAQMTHDQKFLDNLIQEIEIIKNS